MMAIGEFFLGSLLELLFDKFASPALWNFARRQNLRDLLKKWERTLLNIQAVLDDAEEKAMEGDRRVKPWLDDLRDLAYDIDDLLDDFSTEEAIRRLSAPPDAGTSKKRKVNSLLSSIQTSLSPQVLMFDQSVRSKIDEVESRMNDIAEQQTSLGLRERRGGSSPGQQKSLRPPSTSLVDRHVFGRDTDKQKILEMLEIESDDPYSVIPIVGMPGVGKTTLAQLVFNDAKVVNSFAARGWACVSDHFDPVEVTRTILQSVDKGASVLGMGLDMAQRGLCVFLSGKKFLVVLDDVWTEKFVQWDELLKPFQSGARGSKIIVTTRHQSVAMMVGTVRVEAHSLGGLSSGDCLSLFAQSALGVRNVDTHPHLEAMGEKIVEKCGGLPLVAKTLGGLLRSNPNDWRTILESEIWDLPKEKSGIHSALKLSYIHLPSYLKRFFAFCAIFPKEYEFDKCDLVGLWMAEGLLGQQNHKRNMWDRGLEYFDELLSRSFFQQSSTDHSVFVMHDLMNDLAKSVAADTCLSLGDFELDSGKGHTCLEKLRHLSFVSRDYELSARFKGCQRLKGLRTFLALNAVWSSLADKVIDDLLQQLKHLRALSLGGYGVKELPNCIGSLKHLRYLNLTGNQMEHLPDSICALYNLQTLILHNCERLVELPNGMTKLINLQYLDIRGTFLWDKIPPGVVDLDNLKILSNRISCKDGGQRMKYLKHLVHFQEEGGRLLKDSKDLLRRQEDWLAILHLNRLGENAFLKDALNSFHGVNNLSLEWDEDENLNSIRDADSEMQVLNFLQPQADLKGLKIRAYGGTTFPSWIESPSIINVVRLHLLNCRQIVRLPPLGVLPLLKELIIEGMDRLSYVGPEFCGNIGTPFPSLEILRFHQMSVWLVWNIPSRTEGGCDPFPHLHELNLQECPRLGTLPVHFSSLEKLKIDGCPMLRILPCTANLPSLQELLVESCTETLLKDLLRSSHISLTKLRVSKIPRLSCLERGVLISLRAIEELEVEECHDLTCLLEDEVESARDFPHLSRLAIVRCRNIEKLMSDMHSLFSLRDLRIERCSKLKWITSSSGGRFSTSLRNLVIAYCEKLQFLPQGIILPENESSSYCSSSSGSEDVICHQLESLRIIGCPSLVLFAEAKLPASVEQLLVHETNGLESLAEVMKGIVNRKNIKNFSPHLNGLTQLTELRLYNCTELEFLVLPHSLKTLMLEGCKRIRYLPCHMETLTSLTFFYMHGCSSILSFPEGGLPPNLKHLEVGDCPNLKQRMSEWGLLGLDALQSLVIGGEIGCLQLQTPSLFPPDPEKWRVLPPALSALTIRSFPNLVTLSDGLRDHLTSLQMLRIKGCPKLQFLPKEGLPASLAILKIQKCSVALNQQCQKGGDYFQFVERIPYTKVAG